MEQSLETVLCKCGCGSTLLKFDNRNRIRQYIRGHHIGRGENNVRWNNGEMISTYGYRLIRYPNHPHSDVRGYVFEHRLIAEEYLSKRIGLKIFLGKSILIHHINHNKLDNRPENLEITTRKLHNLKHKKNDGKRVCVECKTTVTTQTSTGLERWHKSKEKIYEWLCHRCGTRLYYS